MSTYEQDLAAWTSVLDVFESGLAHHRRLLLTSEDQGKSPWPPAALPDAPLPPELGARAARLLEQSDVLASQMIRKLAEIPTPQQPRRVGQRGRNEHARWTATL